ncbi:MAG: Trm112 family protein [Candidatus Bathyarchaeia archaeon]
MKPWLLNILACPIDKHHPLEAYFFSWETSEDEMSKLSSEAGLPNPDFKKNYEHLAKQLVDGTISPPAIRNIEDASGSNSSKGLLAIAVDALSRLKQAKEMCEEDLLKEFPQDIDALYRFMNLIEVDAGLLVCPECGRWYPIGSAVETIPEMLPDDLRERDRDLEWLEKWRGVVPTNVLEEGKPFNLSG